jgi:hypothetical protein
MTNKPIKMPKYAIVDKIIDKNMKKNAKLNRINYLNIAISRRNTIPQIEINVNIKNGTLFSSYSIWFAPLDYIIA